MSAYRQAAALDRNNPETRLLIGDVLMEQGNYLRAIVLYRQVLDETPNNALAYYKLGLALQGRQRGQEAKEALERARDLYRRQGDAAGVQAVEAALRGLRS